MARKRNSSLANGGQNGTQSGTQNGHKVDFDDGEGLLYRHAFLQSMLHVGCVTEADAQHRYKKITGQHAGVARPVGLGCSLSGETPAAEHCY